MKSGLGSSAGQDASDRTLPCSNLEKNRRLSSNSLSGKDDRLVRSVPTQSSFELDYFLPSKSLSTPSQGDLYEDSSEDEGEVVLDGNGSNDILDISLCLAEVASESFRIKTVLTRPTGTS